MSKLCSIHFYNSNILWPNSPNLFREKIPCILQVESAWVKYFKTVGWVVNLNMRLNNMRVRTLFTSNGDSFQLTIRFQTLGMSSFSTVWTFFLFVGASFSFVWAFFPFIWIMILDLWGFSREGRAWTSFPKINLSINFKITVYGLLVDEILFPLFSALRDQQSACGRTLFPVGYPGGSHFDIGFWSPRHTLPIASMHYLPCCCFCFFGSIKRTHESWAAKTSSQFFALLFQFNNLLWRGHGRSFW